MFDWHLAQITRSSLDGTGEGWIRLLEFEVILYGVGQISWRCHNVHQIRLTNTYTTSLMSFTLALHNIRDGFDCFYTFTRPRKRTIDSHSVSWTSLMLG